MAADKQNAEDKHVRRIRDALLSHYVPKYPRARIDVKRYNSASVRIRIIDPSFAKKDRVDRDDQAWEVLEATLPEETRADISMLILLTPKESKTSLMNLEFEDPSPSVL